ncbi:hypothetical protein [Mesorhizobium jarvisii]|uniref:hypothetical protein n=1 Tax=Mesorhizobium jarvisii TaxID=1777867 RepID=UPI001F0A574E|nr:hypothetical protein [Mesorhizobium jarvisii]MCH4559157.1 hypothetical protein [Mesorhizobium jarvisii]
MNLSKTSLHCEETPTYTHVARQPKAISCKSMLQLALPISTWFSVSKSTLLLLGPARSSGLALMQGDILHPIA